MMSQIESSNIPVYKNKQFKRENDAMETTIPFVLLCQIRNLIEFNSNSFRLVWLKIKLEQT